MISFRPFRGQPSHEDLFAQHYDALMQQALRWTRHDRATAEDLLHDVFLQFVEIEAEMQAPERTLGYLFRMLRNLSISRIRRANSLPMEDLSLVDYDTAESSLAQADRRALLRARYVLQRACSYACERKSSSISASVLILRFFHGYYPSEIVAICKRSRSSIDNFLTLARKETKLAMERPGFLQTIDGGFKQALQPDQALSEDMLLDLCEFIFKQVEGRCLTPREVAHRYSQDDPAPISAGELSHLVSCRACLDRVNERLGLPGLSDRYPPDTTGRESGKRRGPVAVSKTEAERFIAKARRHSRGVRDHRPNQLQIAINGRVKASHGVTSAISTLDLRIEPDRDASFIEVLSEQNVCLLYLSVKRALPHAECDQEASIELSDGRRLSVLVTPELQGTRISVVYAEPAGEPLGVQHPPAELLPAAHARAGVAEGPRERPSSDRLWSGLSRSPKVLYQICLTGLTKIPKPAPIPMSPTLATAVILAIASIACIVLWVQEPPQMSADTLLVRAEAWDRRPTQDVESGVIYQNLRVTTPSRSFDLPLYRDTRGLRRRRIQKVKGEPEIDGTLRDQLTLAGVDPVEPLSAAGYQHWRDTQRERTDRIGKTGRNLLKLTTKVASGPFAKMSLTVRADDFHPVERTVELRDKTGSIDIAELTYQVLPWDSKTEALFEPEDGTHAEHRLQQTPAMRLPRLPQQISDLQLDEAELSARLMLNRLHADNGERIDVVRTATAIQVSGIVETDDRKRELESQLRQLSNVHPSLLTYREMEQRLSPASSGSVTVASVTSQPTLLQTYLEERGWSQQRIGEFSFELSRNAELIKRECKAIDELTEEFASRKVLSLKADAALAELLEQHRNSLIEAIRKEQGALSVATDLPLANAAGASPVSTLTGLAASNVDMARTLTSADAAPPSANSASPAPVRASGTLTGLMAIVNSLQVTVLRLDVVEIAKGAHATPTNAMKSPGDE